MRADSSRSETRRALVLAGCLGLAMACAARNRAGGDAPAAEPQTPATLAPSQPAAVAPPAPTAAAAPNAPAPPLESAAPAEHRPGAGVASDGAPGPAAGPPADHVKDRHGALHKRGAKRPFGDCTSCHGQDLRGEGRAPSCYGCHGKKWH
jgi:hypothetical protein